MPWCATARVPDLTGTWDGQFAYPAGTGPVTPFLATITQSGGNFSGSIIEPDLYRPSATTEAVIAGVVAGAAVDFTKTYRKASMGYENPVDYVGQLSEDGNRIWGVWSLLEWNGTFEMTRSESVKVEEEARATEEVDR